MLRLTASDRVRPLADALAEVLADPLDDPMQPEWIAVPTEGMQRWLQLELARTLGATDPGGDGVSANITYRFPGALRQAVLDAERAERAEGADGRADPWRVEHLVWAVLEVLHAGRGDEQLGPLTSLPAGATWFGRARRLADLFDRYATRRPELLRAWCDGRDVDATGAPLDAADGWQPHLFRLTRECIGEPSPPERLPELLAGLRDDTLTVDLPPRLAVFGITTLPGGAPFLDVAEALGVHREVHLLLLDPSPAAVGRVRALAGSMPPGEGLLRGDDRSDGGVRHPLLRSWGRPYRERTLLLVDAESRGLPAPVRVDLPDDPSAGTLLARVQHDLRIDTPPAADHDLDPDDRSIQVHSCHGPARQVEVLRDAVLHLLADDPTLREEDIVVLAPSIEEFLPWIEPGFGSPADASSASDAAGPPRLAYRIADRSLRESFPLLAALDALLALVAGRFTASAVLEFVSLGPVRARFDLDDDAVAAVARWITDANVRWGLDGEHRAAWGVPAGYAAHSWRAGLDRLLMGVAVSDDGGLAPADIAPLGVEGGDILTAGRLADVLAHLGDLADDFDRSRPAGDWCAALLDATDRLFAVDGAQRWQRDQLLRIVADIADHATIGERDSTVELTLADVRRLLAERLRGAPRRPDFFRGGITFSSLTPLRGLPFRVVCLLGLDDASLTTGAPDGDDLTVRAPRLGDRDARAELRQELLEAVLAAGDHLVVTRTGHNVLTNQDVPESVALAELRDTIVATLAGDGKATYAARVETVHPHQPFDERCFRPGALRPGPWSFDATALAGAHARAARSDHPVPFLAEPLAPAPAEAALTLADLQSFFKHPVKAFLTRRLRLHLPREDPTLLDHLPTALDGLETWNAAQRLIDARLDGFSAAAWAEHEQAQGTLPAGGLGDQTVDEIDDAVGALLGVAAELGVEARMEETHPIDVTMEDGTRLVGSVDLRCDTGWPGPARLTYSKAQAKQHLEAWLDLLALTATDPKTEWRSVVVRRDAQGRRPEPLELVVRGETALERTAHAHAGLTVALDCYRRGLREPIPLFTRLSRRLYDGAAGSGDWWNPSGFAEGTDDPHVLAFGAIDFFELRALPARDDDPPGPDSGRAQRFAQHLWSTVDTTACNRLTEEAVPPEPPEPAVAEAAR